MNAITVAKLPLLAVLKIFEPIVRIGLGVLAFCGTLIALFFRYFTDLPHVPFWGMLAFALGCALALMGYTHLVRLLSR
jgi:hypothetical protein